MWIIRPKEKLIALAKSSKCEDLSLLLETYIFEGGDQFGHHFTGHALINCTLEFKREMESAREEWVKITYLSYLANDLISDFFVSVKPFVGVFELSEVYFDTWWTLVSADEKVDVNEVQKVSKEIKSRIKASENSLVNDWLSEIKGST